MNIAGATFSSIWKRGVPRVAAVLSIAVAALGFALSARAQQGCKLEDRQLLTVWDVFNFEGVKAAGPAVAKIHAAFQKVTPVVTGLGYEIF